MGIFIVKLKYSWTILKKKSETKVFYIDEFSAFYHATLETIKNNAYPKDNINEQDIKNTPSVASIYDMLYALKNEKSIIDTVLNKIKYPYFGLFLPKRTYLIPNKNSRNGFHVETVGVIETS